MSQVSSGKGNAPAGASRSATPDWLTNLFLGTDKGQAALMALRANAPDGPALVRDAVISILRDAVSPLLIESQKKICAEVLGASELGDGAPEWFTRAHDENHSILKRLNAACNDLLDAHKRELIFGLLKDGALRHGLFVEQPQEKHNLAEYVVNTFFRDKLRCFIQASTTSVYLAESLGKNTQVPSGCLIHTNSVVFPLALLKETGRHSVYAFCGASYDEVCGGWLFPPGETSTVESLQKLFRRDGDPLTTAFLLPIATTVEEGIFFHRADAVELASILCQEAAHIVIMTLADRVCRKESEVDRKRNPGLAYTWGALFELRQPKTGTPKRISLVIAPEPHGKNMAEFAKDIAAKGVDLHWFDNSTNAWKNLPAPAKDVR